jgi:hypothetical protein
LIKAVKHTHWACALLVIAACGDRGARVERDTTAARAPATERPALAPDSIPADTISPEEVVRRYYDAIQKRDYDAAYGLWEDGGKSSGKSRAEFAAGFAQTAQVRVAIGDSVRSGAAAGSQYVTVPVTIDAVLRSGVKQHFTGTYIIRRAMVDGATVEQRRWHIYSADLHRR